MPENAQTLTGIAFRAAGKSVNNFPVGSNFARKLFQQGISDATAFSSFLTFPLSSTPVVQPYGARTSHGSSTLILFVVFLGRDGGGGEEQGKPPKTMAMILFPLRPCNPGKEPSPPPKIKLTNEARQRNKDAMFLLTTEFQHEGHSFMRGLQWVQAPSPFKVFV